MCESVDWQKELPQMSFAVAAMAELCTESGSYKRVLAEHVCRSLRADLEKAAEQWAAERKKKE